MSKIDDLKLRGISLQSEEVQAMMAAATGASGYGGSGAGSYSYNPSGRCRVVESSVPVAVGTPFATGEIVTSVATIAAGAGALVLFAIMLCFTGDTELYKAECAKLYENCQNKGGSDSIFHNGQSRCDACRVECLSSWGDVWNCQS